jgi:hypothetical protein
MPARPTFIPRHEPEVVLANARQWDGDISRAATTSIASLSVNGIRLTSRYQRADAFEALVEMAESLPPYVAFDVDALHCDGGAGWVFEAVLGDWRIDLAGTVAALLETVSVVQRGGHDGIRVVASPRLGLGASLNVGSRWDELAIER